jgi:hypothetical protein
LKKSNLPQLTEDDEGKSFLIKETYCCKSLSITLKLGFIVKIRIQMDFPFGWGVQSVQGARGTECKICTVLPASRSALAAATSASFRHQSADSNY